LEKSLSLLKDYLFFQKKSNKEKITFALLKALAHVRYWWEMYRENHVRDEFAIFWPRLTWVDFVDALKKKYYPIGNYDDHYTIWTTLRQERDQMMLEYTNIFHTLRTNLGIKDSK
jgi:hypothetical protein